MAKSPLMQRPIRSRTGEVEAAEALAVEGLAFIAEDKARLGRFLELTGLTREALVQVVGTQGFLLAVLEHLAGDESLLLVFAASRDVEPQAVARAIALLGDGTP